MVKSTAQWKLLETSLVGVEYINAEHSQHDHYKVRILATEFLGLELQRIFMEEEEALEVCKAVLKKGTFTIAMWDRTRNPNKFWSSNLRKIVKK